MRSTRLRSRMATFGLAAVLLGGCGPTNNGLPTELTITLPDGSQAPATLGSGVISLADSSWDFFYASGSSQGAAFVRIRFGPEGELAAFENNTIAQQIFGTEILFDGERHPTTQPGLSYAAATYGAQTADAQGFTFEGRLTGFAAGIQAAEGSASASGEFDPDDPNVLRGVFRFETVVTLLDIPEGNQSDEFNFVGQRVTE